MKVYTYTKERREAISKGRLKRKDVLGYLNSPATRKKMSEAKKGKAPWNKGKKTGSEELGANWKGDNVGYHGLHIWVRKHLGKPQYCEHCKTTEKIIYHWANKSQEYKRDLSDWIRLCVSCHSEYDKSWINRKRDSKGKFL